MNTSEELDQLDRKVERRLSAADFRRRHPEYAAEAIAARLTEAAKKADARRFSASPVPITAMGSL